MDLVRDWLRILGGVAPEALAADLAELAGRDPYAREPGAAPAIQAAEWSLRTAGPPRFAWNVDRSRTSAAAVAGVLARWAPLPREVEALIHSLEGVHLQVGRDASRAKLYVYARGAPPGTLARVEASLGVAGSFGALRPPGGAAPAFVAVDVEGSPENAGPIAVKRYVPLAQAEAAAWLDDLGFAALGSWARSLPPAPGTPPAAFVVSVRVDPDQLLDATLHVKVDRAPETLANLAEPDLVAQASRRFRDAARLGLLLKPTYVSRLLGPRGAGLGSVYYRLEPRG